MLIRTGRISPAQALSRRPSTGKGCGAGASAKTKSRKVPSATDHERDNCACRCGCCEPFFYFLKTFPRCKQNQIFPQNGHKNGLFLPFQVLP